ncbi:MAG: hypothetical protein NXI31_14565 [bacterium]|nr:hypothetical protein [bacterium]
MNPQHAWLAALLLCCPLAAQEGEAAKPTGADARLEALQKEQKSIYDSWLKERREAAKKMKAGGKQARAISMRPDYSGLRGKFLAAADEFQGDAPRFLVPALNLSNGADDYRMLITRIVDNHLDSPEVGSLGRMLGYLDRMVDEEFKAAVVKKVKAHGKNAGLMGWITFQEHEPTFRSKSPKSDEFVAAKAIVSKAVKAADQEMLTRQYEQLMTEQEKFGIGMAAPDISGIDLDGVSFKLSDYKGKVVFLDFWGDW